MDAPSNDFDWLIRSSLELPPREQWRFLSFEAMLLELDPERDGRPLLFGADHAGPLGLSLADLRRTALRADQWCRQHRIAPGDSLLLVRLPYSSEVPLAAASLALMRLGLRVVLPMSFDRTTLLEMAQATGCRALLWCAGGVAAAPHALVRQADAMYRSVADTLGLPTFSLDGDHGWHLPGTPDLPDKTAADRIAADATDEREVLVLSTSGSTGTPKLVRYTDTALLRVAEAWNAAGLMSPELTGGRSICPTLSHSMGLRSVLHAVWNREPVLLAQPEWLSEKPKQFIKLLERCSPQHVTCGPALLSDLSLLAASVKRVRDALASLRCVVSSGAADVARKRVFPETIRLANAFGMTEVQQVLNTLLGSDDAVRGALGSPLPGVSVAVRYTDAPQRVGRLFVASPFSARGYVASDDFGSWFETGDLVRVVGDDLVWMGRSDEDFLNTGHGVKVSVAELRGWYQEFQRKAEAVLFVESPTHGGVLALAYVGQQDPTSADVQRKLLDTITLDHQSMADENRDFVLAYMAITVVGCIHGRPPTHGVGKIDRNRALADQADLLAAMDDPVCDHPQVFGVPQFGSERPDWRRYASGT